MTKNFDGSFLALITWLFDDVDAQTIWLEFKLSESRGSKTECNHSHKDLHFGTKIIYEEVQKS